MSTFLTVISFPFWLFGVIFVLASVANNLTIKTNGRSRKASFGERVCVFVAGIILLVIAYLLIG